MTLFECVKTFIAANGTLAAKLPGGAHPGIIPQNRAVPVQTLCVVRYVSGTSQPPTHDGGASPWSSLRIELTFWGDKYKDLEQCAIVASGAFGAFNGYLGGGSNGRFSCSSVQGPRSLYDADSRMSGIQLDVIGLLNGDTLS